MTRAGVDVEQDEAGMFEINTSSEKDENVVCILNSESDFTAFVRVQLMEAMKCSINIDAKHCKVRSINYKI